jgi:hypothetical protein
MQDREAPLLAAAVTKHFRGNVNEGSNDEARCGSCDQLIDGFAVSVVIRDVSDRSGEVTAAVSA